VNPTTVPALALLHSDADSVIPDLDARAGLYHRNRLVGGGILVRVDQQVGQYPSDLLGPGFDNPWGGRELHPSPGRCGEAVDFVAYHLIKRGQHGLLVRGAFRCQLDQLGDQIAQGLQVGHGTRNEAFPLLGRQVGLRLNELDLQPQAGEWRAQLVTGVGDQPTLLGAAVADVIEQGIEAGDEVAKFVGPLTCQPFGELLL